MKKLIVINFIIIKFLYAQISPGELSSHHAKFDGLNNCTKCHTIGEGLDNKKCLECHTEIRSRIEKNLGYHSSNEVKAKDCWKCHSEHNGRNFKIINFNPKQFDHRKTGYELTGQHKLIDCSKCHNQKFISDTKLKKVKTYLGLSRNCISCHEDIHQKTAGITCENCHNTSSFSSDIKFDHSRTSFPLLGAHNLVKCTECHKKIASEEKSIVKFTTKQKSLCTDCHIDVHNNKFGSNCLSCHNFNSFKNAAKKDLIIPKQVFH
jgi:predicted CXXCH cytochrome family protein